MKPRNAFIAGCFILAGVGIVMAAISGSLIISKLPSSDLAEPFRHRATHYNQQGANFVVFSSFVFYLTLQVAGFVVGISLIGFSALTAWKHLIRPRPVPKI
ncbi:hypothetical protein [Bradyrhizobium sp. STM 3562]|uniref:hypothetical protein n=1 Tax=Bradyrhizobium sp. STM 3562 TaxID=578924 RepID=UPI00388CF5A1